jgi:hypothetical protein
MRRVLLIAVAAIVFVAAQPTNNPNQPKTNTQTPAQVTPVPAQAVPKATAQAQPPAVGQAVPSQVIPAPADTLPPSKARISFDSEKFDFGFAPQGSAFLVHTFEVSNVGEESLYIANVRPTCGCTAAPLKKNKLAPKEKTEITSIFKLRGYTSSATKSIKVESNDPTKKNASLQFSANMDTLTWKDITKGPRVFAEPKLVTFTKGDLPVAALKVKLTNPTDKPLTIKVIEYTKDYLKEPKFKISTIKAGKFIDMEIHLIDTFDKNAELKGSITIAAFDESKSEVTRFTIPVTNIAE